MGDQLQVLQQSVDKLQRQMSEMRGAGQTTALGASSSVEFVPVPPTGVPPSAVNQLYNTECGHSVDTWYNPPPGSPTLDVGKECAHIFSNDIPAVLQVLDFTDSRTSPVNQTLKAYGDFGGVHSTYDPEYCDWDRSLGQARFQGTKSLDFLFPNNRIVLNNRAVEYLGALIALRNSTIVVPEDCHLYAGIWDNTNSAPRPDWIKGSAFALTATRRGTAGSTERRYKVLAFTDRGYTYLSEEAVITDAAASFTATDVYLSWAPIDGILQYWVYRFDSDTGLFHLLIKIGSGSNTYGDNGNFVEEVSGYPTSTDTVPKAYVATRTGVLARTAVDGDPWTVLFLNIPIPSDYDVSLQTGEQVLRMGMTVALDRQMTDVGATFLSLTITSDSADFTASDAGRSVTLTDDQGNVFESTIDAIGDATEVDLSNPWPYPNATGVTLYIVEGGDHGLLIDAVHISYTPGAAFAANAEDNNREQAPIAAPNHSSQGGAGGGGDPDPGGGGIGCVALDTPITRWLGDTLVSVPFRLLHRDCLFSGNLTPNWVQHSAVVSTDNLYQVFVESGSWFYDLFLECSPGHPFMLSSLDTVGRRCDKLKAGDHVVVQVDGHLRRMRIRRIEPTGKTARVGSPVLNPGHWFGAGAPRFRSRVHRLLFWLLRKSLPVASILSHNLKPGDEFGAQ